MSRSTRKTLEPPRRIEQRERVASAARFFAQVQLRGRGCIRARVTPLQYRDAKKTLEVLVQHARIEGAAFDADDRQEQARVGKLLIGQRGLHVGKINDASARAAPDTDAVHLIDAG